jgi:hypothetical protein
MDIQIDDNVRDIVDSKDPKIRAKFYELLDQFPILLNKIQENLDINAFDSALLARDVILQEAAALKTFAMQYHKKFGISEQVWEDDEVKALITEAQRMYSIANDLIVNKFQAMNLRIENIGDHEHLD